MSAFGEKKLVARKHHQCSWCGQAIEPGEQYVGWCWRDGGDFAVVKVHAECAVAQENSATEEWHCGEFPRGGVYEKNDGGK